MNSLDLISALNLVSEYVNGSIQAIRLDRAISLRNEFTRSEYTLCSYLLSSLLGFCWYGDEF